MTGKLRESAWIRLRLCKPLSVAICVSGVVARLIISSGRCKFCKYAPRERRVWMGRTIDCRKHLVYSRYYNFLGVLPSSK
jgi:hypothetical protein